MSTNQDFIYNLMKKNKVMTTMEIAEIMKDDLYGNCNFMCDKLKRDNSANIARKALLSLEKFGYVTRDEKGILVDERKKFVCNVWRIVE